jgi:hypothetical protein
MKNAIVLALLLMRMVAEEIVKEAEGNQPQICADACRSAREVRKHKTRCIAAPRSNLLLVSELLVVP